MTPNKQLQKQLDQTTELLDTVYEYINTSRYQDALVGNYNNWNQICSSLWVIGDTVLALKSYLKKRYPKDNGQKYLYTYGVMQVLFTQQDAVINLTDSFGIKTDICPVFREIRNFRNISIGHPTKLARKEGVYYGYISRITLSKNGFTVIRTDEIKKKDQFVDVDLLDYIFKQTLEVNSIIELLGKKLIDNDKEHKNAYKEFSMENIFHESMRYNFEKIGEGIYSSGYGKEDFALSMLESVKKTYEEFKHRLIERKEFNEYIEYDWNQYNHAINKLEKYLLKEDNNMSESDARIYLYYIREEHQHFKEIAKEVDDEYKKENL